MDNKAQDMHDASQRVYGVSLNRAASGADIALGGPWSIKWLSSWDHRWANEEESEDNE